MNLLKTLDSMLIVKGSKSLICALQMTWWSLCLLTSNPSKLIKDALEEFKGLSILSVNLSKSEVSVQQSLMVFKHRFCPPYSSELGGFQLDT